MTRRHSVIARRGISAADFELAEWVMSGYGKSPHGYLFLSNVLDPLSQNRHATNENPHILAIR